MTYKTTVSHDGTIHLGPHHPQPGTVVEVIYTRAGSFIVAVDDDPMSTIDANVVTALSRRIAQRADRRRLPRVDAVGA